jgi:hypothetical protein
MLRIKFKLIILATVLLNYTVIGQVGICGTSVQTQNDLLSERYSPYTNRNAITYVPIRFSVIRSDDGTGGPSISNILDQVSSINRDFSATNIQFYLADGGNFNFINNSLVTNDPPSFNSFLVGQKSNIAVNIYVTKFARNPGTAGGIILGYYTGGGDYIVAIDTEVTKNTAIVSHEIGHYFSLAHTFLGWENDPYDETKHGNPVTVTSVGGVTVETVNKSNCSFAADQICDTPPDYNFGFGANGCTFTKIVRDRNGDTIVTQRNNQMSYFIGCASYVFSKGQTDRMNSNLFSSSRFSLRKNYTPALTPITDNLVVNFPKTNTTVQSFNNVSFDWENVNNAQYYLFTYSDGRTTTSLVTTVSEVVIKDLKPNGTYFYTIRPFSEGFTNTKSTTTLFRTGNIMTSTKDVNQKNSIEIYPNPVSDKLGGVTIQLTLENSNNVQLFVIDATGRQIFNTQHRVQSGNNLINLTTSNLTKGVYFVKIVGNEIDFQRKFVVL